MASLALSGSRLLGSPQFTSQTSLLIQCNNLSDSLKCKDNGRPSTVGRESNGRAAAVALPSFLTTATQLLDRIPVPKSDTRLRIFSGTANPSLSQEIAGYLGLELGKINIKRFLLMGKFTFS